MTFPVWWMAIVQFIVVWMTFIFNLYTYTSIKHIITPYEKWNEMKWDENKMCVCERERGRKKKVRPKRLRAGLCWFHGCCCCCFCCCWCLFVHFPSNRSYFVALRFIYHPCVIRHSYTSTHTHTHTCGKRGTLRMRMCSLLVRYLHTERRRNIYNKCSGFIVQFFPPNKIIL